MQKSSSVLDEFLSDRLTLVLQSIFFKNRNFGQSALLFHNAESVNLNYSPNLEIKKVMSYI